MAATRLNEAQRYPDDFDGIVAGRPCILCVAFAGGLTVYRLGVPERRHPGSRLHFAGKISGHASRRA
jgi:hypothetical protein